MTAPTPSAPLIGPTESLYYCWEHRDQKKVARRQSATWVHRPTCPMCYAPMYWVPSGGTQVPPRPAEETL